MLVAIVGSGSIAKRYKSILEKSFESYPVLISDYLISNGTDLVLRRNQVANSIYPAGHFDLLIIASENKEHLSDYLHFNHIAKKILFEKPLFYRNLSKEEIEKLMKREADISISSPLRFHESFIELTKSLKTVGEISNIESRCQSWLPDWRPGRNFREGFWNDSIQGGILREIVHELDYLLSIFGQLSPVYAYRSFSEFLSLNVESSIDILLKEKKNNLVNVHLDFSSAVDRRYFRIDGSKGSVKWDVLKGELSLISTQGKHVTRTFYNDLDRDLTFKRQLEFVLGNNNWPIPATSLKEGLVALQLIDDIYFLANGENKS